MIDALGDTMDLADAVVAGVAHAVPALDDVVRAPGRSTAALADEKPRLVRVVVGVADVKPGVSAATQVVGR